MTAQEAVSRSWRVERGRYSAPAFVFVGTVLLWEATVRLFQVPTFLLPAPTAIWMSLVGNAGTLALYGFNTFREALGGFLIGCSAGIAVAMVVARYRVVMDVVMPVAVASNSVPIVALAPLAIVWFGIDEGSKIAIVAVMCFFPTLVSTIKGLTSTPVETVDLMKSYAATEWHIFAKVRLPFALPFIFTAFKICSTLSMIGAIVAEFFGGSVKFLGVYIKTEANILHTTQAWAAIVVACMIGLAFYLALVVLERLLLPWYVANRGEAQ